MLADRLKSLENPNIIQNPSPSLRAFAIETFPFEPVYGEIELAILNESDSGVYPKVTQCFGYDVKSGKYVEYAYDSNEDKRATPNHINVSVSDGGMDNFKTSLLPVLAKQGYEIKSADLAVTTFYRRDDGGSGTLGGEYMSTGVVLSKWSIWIQEGNATDEQRQQLADWLGKVKEQQLQQG